MGSEMCIRDSDGTWDKAGGSSVPCGNGVLQPKEACDDGNSADGDGCSSACAVEAKWSCTGSPSACAKVCPDGGTHFAVTNHCYKAYAIAKNHSGTRDYCKGLGRYLVTITSSAENSFVISLLGNWAWIWQGVVNDNGWKYVSESAEGAIPITYSNWHPGLPTGEGACVTLVNQSGSPWVPGEWHDYSCSNAGYFVCEWSW